MSEEQPAPIELSLDLDSFTLEEMEIIETRGEVSLAEFAEAFQSFEEGAEASAPKRPMAKLLRAMAFISLRRSNPEATWEDAGAIKVSHLMDSISEEEGEEGENPPGEPSES